MNKAPYYLFLFIIPFFLLGCSMLPTFNKEKEEKEVAEEVEENNEATEVKEVEEPEESEVEEETTEEEEPESLHTQGDYDIYIGGEVIETEDKIIIEGESNLIPGSRVVGEVSVGKNVRYFINPTVKDFDYLADTSEIVNDDGTFYMELEHPNLDQETEVSVKFHFDGQQNDDVIRHYGDRGQKLEGPYIYKHQGEVGGRGPDNIYQKAEVKTIFTPEKEKAVRQFKEPDWYEEIDDIGDSRVWIEVDEINDDGEYFYVHGRSNLIEGSRVIIKRQNQEAEAMVNPDGSFNFKFDYEYKEDVPFKIVFDPNDYQWNIVEETYGAKGQKLVGNLVETNEYNNNQTIVFEIEHESQEIDVPDNVELEIDGSEVTMLVPDNILFDYDKYELKKEAKETLKEISKTLESSFNKKDLDITINGHTDNKGSKEYNEKLSKQRADEVKKYFESQLKASEIQFTTEGYGDTKPIASNDTEEGQAKNRRVEIIINLK
ncbi:OmpA family protein [Pseudogracilibacillus sp. SE30717A]|uniref:OmpA family protein n=1 Tax=Pseudogracilibacillus sp. SE30717A TaxID=3098293 RepID=UPI00300E3746